jgi:hypothetical protein
MPQETVVSHSETNTRAKSQTGVTESASEHTTQRRSDKVGMMGAELNAKLKGKLKARKGFWSGLSDRGIQRSLLTSSLFAPRDLMYPDLDLQ